MSTRIKGRKDEVRRHLLRDLMCTSTASDLQQETHLPPNPPARRRRHKKKTRDSTAASRQVTDLGKNSTHVVHHSGLRLDACNWAEKREQHTPHRRLEKPLQEGLQSKHATPLSNAPTLSSGGAPPLSLSCAVWRRRRVRDVQRKIAVELTPPSGVRAPRASESHLAARERGGHFSLGRGGSGSGTFSAWGIASQGEREGVRKGGQAIERRERSTRGEHAHLFGRGGRVKGQTLPIRYSKVSLATFVLIALTILRCIFGLLLRLGVCTWCIFLTKKGRRSASNRHPIGKVAAELDCLGQGITGESAKKKPCVRTHRAERVERGRYERVQIERQSNPHR